MNDDFQEGMMEFDDVEGAAPPVFRHVLVGGDGESSRHDAIALVRALADRAETVTVAGAADLIAIGSAAGGPPGRVTLDPAARALLEGARCPVAVAPSGFAARESGELRRIDIGIDGGREAGAALTVAARLARAHGARLRLVAVAEPRLDPAGSALPVDPREPERLARHLEHAADGLPGLWVETELQEGPADRILVALARQAGLLVLGSRAAYGDAGCVSLGGLAVQVLHGATCPTLVAPAP